MKIDILTLFPEMVEPALTGSILGRAREKGLIDIRCHNIRDYSDDKSRRVDDYPYGGGRGMLMRCEPLYRALEDVRGETPGYVVMTSARGARFDQKKALELLARGRLIIICGHYEGVDERFIERCVDEEISLGDFVMTGGEIAAMAISDAVCRLTPGVLADSESFERESHYAGLLEHPQYTRPEEWRGMRVPEVLLSGHHKNIEQWRLKSSLLLTKSRRPDLFERLELSAEQKKLLK